MVEPQQHWDFNYFERMGAAMREAVASRGDSAAFPVIPQRFVRDLREVMPEDGILTLDNGTFKIWIARNYPAYLPGTVLLDNALATMGAGLPAAIAAKLAAPDKKVVAVCGDGGFMMNSQELETAMRLKLDLVVLILNDNGYGMIKWKQHDMGFEDYGLDLGNPDFVRYAESYGAKGYRIESADAFAPLLRSRLDRPGVHVIEIPVDYSENRRVLTEELRQNICPL